MVLNIKTIKYKDKVVFEKVVMTADFRRIPKIFQETEACFMLLTKGAFQFRTPANVLNFTQGDGMLSKCGNYYIEQLSGSPEHTNENISAIAGYFYPGIVKHFFQAELTLTTFKANYDTKKISAEPLIKSFFEGIDYLLDNPQLADDDLIANKLKELLLLLSKTEQAKSVSDFVSSLFVPYEYNFTEVIQNNLYANLSLKDFAKLCNYSLATFKRKFTEHYNESPAKYIISKKLEKAAQLLELKSMQIADIAYACGFETIPNFNKAFKKHFGKSPSEYRLS
jgi:AraC family transcriptional regulator, exoenzyme S synthesis regulatory protein ExsA